MEESFFFQTPVGVLRAVFEPAGLARLEVADAAEVPENQSAALSEEARRLARAIEAYFTAGTPFPDMALSPSGTPFQLSVWAALREIPFGETRTYAEIARAIGRPGAVRAVGQACGANPLLLITPCHRLLAAGNRTGGFSAGLWRKKALLEHEQRFSSGLILRP